ncbi:murein biosynthesis integral membrane protein MurJ [Peptostreptococcus faecalis]|uniref:murein biosynthesis integral membrane protein MurJ n=1 Tax=Peptostreptococcus faecalis TaxID=2045015 RepID=UPI000C7AEB45|nr:murein biosynthesis integral membrane protein MurJ [Peptostreptococcus faecalis]
MSKTVKATFLLMVVTILSKILGLARDSVLASAYGTGTYTAVYTTANNIPVVLFAVIGSALATSLIPLYNKLVKEDSEERAMAFLNSVINTVVIVCLVISVIGIIGAKPLVKVFAPGYTGEVYELCVQYTRILLPSIIFVGLANIFTAFLQIKKRFVVPGLIGMPYSIIIIVSILISLKTSPVVLIVGTLIAILAKTLFQVPFVYKEGYKYSRNIDLHDPIMKDMLILIIPVVIGVGANQINAVVDKSLASLLGTNVVASFNYAMRLYEFVQALFITSILSVVYPKFSSLVVLDKIQVFVDSMVKTMNVIIIALVPVIIGCIVLANPIVEVLFQRNAFKPEDTIMTANILVIYITGVLPFALRDVMSRGFYSVEDSKTPMTNSIIAIALNIILNLAFIKPFGYQGLALGTAISAYIGLFLFNRSMKKKITEFNPKSNIIVFIKCLISALIMAVVVTFVFGAVTPLLQGGLIIKVIKLGLSVLIGALVYAIVMYFMKVEEYTLLLNLAKNGVKSKFKKVTK